LKTHLISAEDVPYIWDVVGSLLPRVEEHIEGGFGSYDCCELTLDVCKPLVMYTVGEIAQSA